MNLRQIRLEHYRNLTDVTLTPSPAINVIYGKNAQGKTNFLEAIWLFSGMKSFRGGDHELVQFGEAFANLKIFFFAEGREQEAEIKIENARRAFLNGIALKSPAKLSGVMGMIVFSPAHLSMVKEGPAGRRHFLDVAIACLRPRYISLMSDYQRAVAQRNAMLKDIRYHAELSDMMEIYEQRIAASGAKIIRYRENYIETLKKSAPFIYSGISSEKETLSLRYLCSAGENEEDSPGRFTAEVLFTKLREGRRGDIAQGFTGIGPHRDDLWIGIDGRSARNFGSQGQQRSAVLSLKLAEAAVMEHAAGERPVILLDDVMSELDETRQDYILNRIGGSQVFITCCDPNSALKTMMGEAFCMDHGKIVNCK